MHELAVTENLLEITIRHAKQANASKVTDLFIVVGQLSSIIGDSVQFYWDLISVGTPAEKAKLHFDRREAKFKCLSCEQVFVPLSDSFVCPSCSNEKVKVISGNEFYLESILIENLSDDKE